MAKEWYGHGQWNAPYWFVGPEPGMAKTEGDDLTERCLAWQRAGGGSLIDCARYHKALKIDSWHSANAQLQPTWGKLIRLLLSFQGQKLSRQMIVNYQRGHWGGDGGETCVIELSPLAANNTGVDRDRKRFLTDRTAFLRSTILQCKPTFVVMYGKGCLSQWQQIAGGEFDNQGIREIGTTIALTTKHPVARGARNQDWEQLGKLLRARCSEGNSR